MVFGIDFWCIFINKHHHHHDSASCGTEDFSSQHSSLQDVTLRPRVVRVLFGFMQDTSPYIYEEDKTYMKLQK